MLLVVAGNGRNGTVRNGQIDGHEVLILRSLVDHESEGGGR